MLLILLLCSCASCSVPRIDLSPKEEELQEKLQHEFNNPNIELRHDYDAITENRRDGEFWITISTTLPDSTYTDFCKSDSTRLKDVSKAIVTRLQPILSNRNNYSTIEFRYTTDIVVDPISTRSLCSKGIVVPLSDINKVRVRDYYENY